jgi:hypothetical protein
MCAASGAREGRFYGDAVIELLPPSSWSLGFPFWRVVTSTRPENGTSSIKASHGRGHLRATDRAGLRSLTWDDWKCERWTTPFHRAHAGYQLEHFLASEPAQRQLARACV